MPFRIRLGVPSVAKQAALSLAGNTEAWAALLDPDQRSWLVGFKSTILAELENSIADANERSQLAQHVTRLLDEENMETLQQAAVTITRSPINDCIQMWDRAPLASVSRACGMVLDRISTALITVGPDEDGTSLVTPRGPAGICALCGLSFIQHPCSMTSGVSPHRTTHRRPSISRATSCSGTSSSARSCLQRAARDGHSGSPCPVATSFTTTALSSYRRFGRTPLRQCAVP